MKPISFDTRSQPRIKAIDSQHIRKVGYEVLESHQSLVTWRRSIVDGKRDGEIEEISVIPHAMLNGPSLVGGINKCHIV